MDNKSKGLFVVLIAVVLILSGTVGYLAVKYDNVKGEAGDIGLTGVPGAEGLSGLQGPQGIPGANGTDGEQGPKGNQGNQGSNGGTGATGPQGESGEDCQCNEPPIITVNTSDSYASSGDFYFTINISVEDPENDMRIINLFHKHNEDDPWLRVDNVNGHTHGYMQHWYSDNNSDYFIETHVVDYVSTCCEDLWWLVEVDDGSNLVIVEEYLVLNQPI